MKEYIAIGALVHIVNMDTDCADSCFCGVSVDNSITVFEDQFNLSQLCLECRVREISPQFKVTEKLKNIETRSRLKVYVKDD